MIASNVSVKSVPAATGAGLERPAPQPIRLVEPRVPRPADLLRGVVEILGSGQLTGGWQVERFEAAAAEYLEVEHCVAVSSCTSGLMLSARCLGLQGEVILPSLTFFASGHALLWNNLEPVFADCDPETFQISLESAGRVLSERTSAILGVHLYGCPAPVDELEGLASAASIPLIFDGAHAWGARWKGRSVASYGAATVYSLSPTKQVTAGEGGIVATSDDLAEALRKARNYGKGDSYDCDILGLNARMTEIQGLMARLGLYGLDREISRRRALASVYEEELAGVLGVQLQRTPAEVWHSRKDFPVVVPADARPAVEAALAAEGVETRRYFDPPLHRQKLYRRFHTAALPNTDAVSNGVVCLPLHGGMQRIDAERIARITREQF